MPSVSPAMVGASTPALEMAPCVFLGCDGGSGSDALLHDTGHHEALRQGSFGDREHERGTRTERPPHGHEPTTAALEHRGVARRLESDGVAPETARLCFEATERGVVGASHVVVRSLA